MIPRYVFDTGALIAAERGKQRAARFLQLVQAGRARILVPLPVVAEWWRGRSDAREEILTATEVVASLPAAKAAGVALGRLRHVDAKLTVDAIVMADSRPRRCHRRHEGCPGFRSPRDALCGRRRPLDLTYPSGGVWSRVRLWSEPS